MCKVGVVMEGGCGKGRGSLVLCLHQVKTSTSTEILQLDEMLNEVRVECH